MKKKKKSKGFLSRFQPTKVMDCPNCRKSVRFPVRSGRVLRITCPKCRATFQVSFVNPITSILKGKLKWSMLGKKEKTRLVIIATVLVVVVIMMVYSFVKPNKNVSLLDNNINNVSDKIV